MVSVSFRYLDTGVNLNCSVLRDPIVSTIHSLEIPSRVVGLIPAVMFPGLLFNLS